MKVCLLFLSVVTLLQLISGYERPAGVELWRPSVEKLSSIIHICEHKLNLEGIHRRPRTSLLNKANVNANVGVQVGRVDLSLSKSLDVDRKLGLLPIGGILQPSLNLDKNVDVKLDRLDLSSQKSLNVDRKLGLLPVGGLLQPSLSLDKNVDVQLGRLDLSSQKSLDVDRKLGLLPVGGVLQPSLSLDKNVDVKLDRLDLSSQKSLNVDRKLGLLPVGGVLRPSLNVGKNVDVKLGGASVSFQKSLDQDRKLGLLPIRGALQPSLSLDKNVDVQLGRLDLSSQKSLDVDRKLGLLPVGGVLQPSLSLDKNVDVKLDRLDLSSQKSLNVDRKLGLLPVGGVLRPSLNVGKNVDVKLGGASVSFQKSLDVDKKLSVPSIASVTRSPGIIDPQRFRRIVVPFAGNANVESPRNAVHPSLIAAYKLLQANAANLLAGNTRYDLNPKLADENPTNRKQFSIVPIKVQFAKKDDDQGVPYYRPAAPPISNVVTINNENKHRDRLLSRTLPVDINIGHKSVKNLNNAHDDAVTFLSGRTLAISKKQKYRKIAACVNSRLLKAYEEEMAFYD